MKVKVGRGEKAQLRSPMDTEATGFDLFEVTEYPGAMGAMFPQRDRSVAQSQG